MPDPANLPALPRSFALRPLPLLLAALWVAPLHAQSVESADAAQEHVAELESVTVSGARSADEIGHDNVYEKDISNVYTDREYLDRYQGVSVGDVFAGMNGVYNSDNRHGSALFPNLRGLSGNGRVPVTVDGTQQSLDVWMAFRGVNNRNYVDPNLFRSIEVEKGPSMTRGIKSGVGGSVNIRTLEAEDIIAPGKNWGLEFKASTASNSVKDGYDPFAIVGKDYRDVPSAVAAQAAWGSNRAASFLEPQMVMRERGETSRFNGDDRKASISAAYRHEVFDVMLAYSDAQRGNYFAGTRGADKFNDDIGQKPQVATALYPYMAKLYPAGYEVPYTNNTAKSVLAKNNWYFPHDQKISLSYTHNRLNFGELPLLDSEIYLGLAELEDLTRQIVYPYPNSRVNQKTYRMGYEFKPEGSRWVDMEVALWRTENQSTRYQNGDTTYEVGTADTNWDMWTNCKYNVPAYAGFCKMMYDFGLYDRDKPPDKLPNTDGQYNIFIGNRQDTRAVRSGLDASNRFQLSDTLALTATGNWQYERNRDHLPVETGGVMGVGISQLAFGPASGRREEMGGGLNLEWQALPRLQLSAGVSYGSFWGHDDETDRRRDEQHGAWASTRVNTHQKLQYRRLSTDEEMVMYEYARLTGDWDEWQAHAAANHIADPYAPAQRDSENKALYRKIEILVPLIDGKADRHQNPFYNGQNDLNETMNAQGGTYPKYRTGIAADPNSFSYYQPADRWQHTERQRSHAWSTQLVVSYQLVRRTRVYGRLAQMARFPSILEFANRQTLIGEFPYALKPERNQAWEIGLAYDLGGLLPGVPQSDVKLSWYHNTIRNYFDRTENMNVIQFDRKIMSGVELQGRFDAGILYGSLGGTLRLRQDMCDADYAVQRDPMRNRIPECMPGGFGGTMSFLSLQPKYSINLDAGVRLFERKLDLGLRMRHHSRASNKKFERLYAEHGAAIASSRPYFWRPVMLFDAYAEYVFNRYASARLSAENLTDRYYLDPMAKVPLPGPGRTVRMDLALRY